MANPPKAKGTAGETELLRLLQPALPGLRRTSAGSRWDLETPTNGGNVINLLAFRPDRGKWLVTMDLPTFVEMLPIVSSKDPYVHIEVKRYSRFAHYSLFQEKFGEPR